MPIAEEEAVACLKVLVAVAKADGRIQEGERKSLAAAIARFELPVSVSVEAVLEGDVDLDAELAKITSPEAREQVYRSASFLAAADGRSAPEEQALLVRIANVVQPSDELRGQLASLAPTSSRGPAFLESLRGLFRSRAD